jgi:hypothetical protein
MCKSQDCSICYEELKTNNICVITCNHDFCFNCIVKYIDTANKNNYTICCPVCRKNMIINQNNEEQLDN